MLNRTDDNNNNNKYILGIDGGGSKTRAIIVDNNNTIIGTGLSGPANPLHGFEQATHSVTESAELALKDANLSGVQLNDLVAGIGLAGVNLPVLFDQVSHWKHPFGQMFLATDLFIACLGAHGGHDGAVMITGTGSCGFSYVGNEAFNVGGHGFPHGDKGSGAWFGLQAISHVLMSLDGLAADSLLNEKLFALLKVSSDVALVEAIACKPAAYHAKIANLVFDAAEDGDQIAKNIVLDGANYISNMAKLLLKKKATRLCLIGGLTPRIKPWLAAEIKTELAEPIGSPEMGAVLFAQQQIILSCKSPQVVA
jgi:glucosamine kinase